MKITEIIDALEEIKDANGDIECLVEVDGYVMVPVGELSVENRHEYGMSVAFLL